MAERAFTWYSIPAGTKPTECRSADCCAEIYFIPSPKGNGKSIPVSVEVGGASGPTDTENGRGISHFQDCTAVRQFQKRSAAS